MPSFPLWSAGSPPQVLTTPQTVQSGAFEMVKAGAANTKSAWTALNAPTNTWAYSGFLVQFNNNGLAAEASSSLIDIAFGTTIIVSNLLAFNDFIDYNSNIIHFPLAIPPLTQVQARLQQRSVGGAPAIEFWGIPFDPRMPAPMGRVTTYGANTADSGGVEVDCGAVANTKVRTTIATTTNPMHHMIVCIGDAGITNRSDGKILFDIEIGTNNRIIYQGITLRSVAVESVHPNHIQFPCTIPAGTPIKINAQCTSTNSNARVFDVVILGID